MAKIRTKLLAGIAVGALAASLAACGSSSKSDDASSSSASTPTKGGTVTWLDVAGTFEAADPAGIYLGEELTAFRRTVYRGLTALPISSDPNAKVLPDLATDIGTTTDGGKTWVYTIKDGVKWQDGKAITCADFQYGAARGYDSSLVSPGGGVGTTYFAQYGLFDPTDPSFDFSNYTGPLTDAADTTAHLDNAISCDGNKITYHFQNAWPDFPSAAASLFSTDPYEASFEKGAAGQWLINSDGPYEMQDASFNNQTGATFVRNPNYDPSTDSTKVRGAYPDTIKFEMVADPETITERLIADSGDDQTAFTPANIPSDKYSEVTSIPSSRIQQTTSPYTRYLNINYLTMTDPNERRALQLATDKTSAIQAYGGKFWGTATSTIVSSAIPGFQENPSLKGDNPAGDPAAAKKLLNGATPAITYAFGDSPTNEKVAAALQAGWQKAGFVVTLDPIPTDAKPSYYGQMGQKTKNGAKVDVFLGGWASDWPTLFGVIPPILQSNPADADFGVGFNYGFYSNSTVDSDIQKAVASTDTAEQTKLLQDADAVAGKDGAYVPLANQKNYFIYGSKVGGFLADVASSYYPDLGGIYVKK